MGAPGIKIDTPLPHHHDLTTHYRRQQTLFRAMGVNNIKMNIPLLNHSNRLQPNRKPLSTKEGPKMTMGSEQDEGAQLFPLSLTIIKKMSFGRRGVHSQSRHPVVLNGTCSLAIEEGTVPISILVLIGFY